jgi:acyl-CoA thioester hydrolase
MEGLLKSCPVVIDIPVVWGEMDALRHVNNVVYFRYFESARMAYLTRLDMDEFGQRTGVATILASTQCSFRIPLTYPDTVSVGTRVAEMDEDRIVMQYYVWSHKFGKMAASGEGVLVPYDYLNNRKTILPDELKRRFLALEASVSPRA